MKTDLHELLDRPLPGEPPTRNADRYLTESRRALRRRRWVSTAASLGGAAAVATVVLATGLTDVRPEGAVAQSPPNHAGSPVGDQQTEVLSSIRARHPYAALTADCLLTQGWNPTFTVDGGISIEGTTDTYDEYRAAIDDCSQLTSDEWHSLYKEETATAGCLRGLQEVVPQIPPFSTFVDRYPNRNHWNSYSFVTARPGDGRWELLNTQCPQPTLG